MKTKNQHLQRGSMPSPVPAEAIQLFNEAMALQQQKKLCDACDAYQRCLAKYPQHTPARINLGLVLRELGQVQAAIEQYNLAIKTQAKLAEAYLYRGVAQSDLKDYLAAVASFDQAIALKPDLVNAHFNRGNAWRGLENHRAAVESYDRAIHLAPQLADAHANRGNSLVDAQLFGPALQSFNQAIAIQPENAVLYFNRATCHAWMANDDDAKLDIDAAIRLNPGYAEAYAKRADIFGKQKKDTEALEDLKRAYALNPDITFIIGNVIHKKFMQCDWSDSKTQFEMLIPKVSAGAKAVHPWDFMSISDDPVLQFKCAKNYGDSLLHLRDKGNAEVGSKNITRKANKKIKIGYYSSDFHDHPVMHLMNKIFENHDKSRFELIAFSFNKNSKDAYQKLMKNSFNKFYQVYGFSENDIIDLSEDLNIDIAVDLLGYTGEGKPGIFYNRCAPVQINFLGYAGTIGCEGWDYFIADKISVPEVEKENFSENIIFLPDTFQPNDDTKEISESDFIRSDFDLPENSFVFCCSNNLYKIAPEVFDIWMRLLSQVPRSVLWLFTENKLAKANLRKEALLRGVEPNRLVFGKRMPKLADHLARYRLADLFLDTFPYNAHTTASDALWAGLPVLTCAGRSFVSRVAASLLAAIGLPELITCNHQDYEALAVRLATNPDELQAIQRKLLVNRVTAPLFNTELYTRNLERAYQVVFNRHAAGLPPDHIYL